MYEIIARSKVLKIEQYDVIYKYECSESIDFFNEDLFNKYNKNNEIFIIIYKNKLLGVFTLRDDNFILNDTEYACVKIDYFYVCKKYRTYGLGTLILTDIIWIVKRFRKGTNYILADSLVESCMFYLKKGFDYYKSTKSENSEYNIITMYKKIR
ncbi:MAG: GNAT family N-acetyltransferase [Methanosphaera sp.]|nr:GNAT family N-acetyltransferase [Methanosphaera sp.]